MDGNLLACHAAGVSGKVFNLACGGRITLNQVVLVLNRILGTDLKPIYEALRQGDIRHSMADISRAREELKFTPQVDFEEGLKMTVDWYREYLKKG